MDEVRFTIIVHAHDTDPFLFKKMIKSISDINYKNFELIIIDSNQITALLPSLINEIMPRDGRVVYRKARLMNEAEALNAGLRLMSGDYCLFLGQYDMLSPSLFAEIERICISSLLPPENSDIDFNILTKAASGDRLRLWKRTAPDLIYTDYDEIVDGTRMNPHFEGGFSPELLCQSYYFNRAFAISIGLLRRVGIFDTKYIYGHIYDYLLRILDESRKNENSSERIRIYHLPGLYYHLIKRIYNISAGKKIDKDIYIDLRRAALSYLNRNGFMRKLSNEPDSGIWAFGRETNIEGIRKNDYILMKDDDVKVNAFPKAIADMYSYLKEKDVAVVGAKFVNKGRIINCGFIYDENGFIYPACSGNNSRDRGYENRICLTQDVSMVDPSFCLIDEKIFRHLGGFNTGMLARDAMLDFCLRAISRGYRIVYDANVTAQKNEIYNGSSEMSHNKLLEYYGENGSSKIRFSDGDRYYNPNLRMGVTNYFI